MLTESQWTYQKEKQAEIEWTFFVNRWSVVIHADNFYSAHQIILKAEKDLLSAGIEATMSPTIGGIMQDELWVKPLLCGIS